MKFLAMIIIYLVANNAVSAVSIGLIRNASLMMISSSNITLNRSTCDECLCAMLMSTGNSSIVSFNCYIKQITSVVCQLFTVTDYQISTFYQVDTNFNSIFYFLQLPLNDQLQMTTAKGRTL
jgi:hypothetical protein